MPTNPDNKTDEQIMQDALAAIAWVKANRKKPVVATVDGPYAWDARGNYISKKDR